MTTLRSLLGNTPINTITWCDDWQKSPIDFDAVNTTWCKPLERDFEDYPDNSLFYTFDLTDDQGDYGRNGAVGRSNYQVFLDLLIKMGLPDEYYRERFYSYGAKSVLLRADIPEPWATKIYEIVGALDDYPLLDEQHYSELSFNEQTECYGRSVESELIRAIEDLDDSITNIESTHLYTLFLTLFERNNCEWIDEGGDWYLDTDRLLKGLTIDTVLSHGITFECSPEYFRTLNHWSITKQHGYKLMNTEGGYHSLPQHILNALDPRQIKLL
jgi:hypothetical protein